MEGGKNTTACGVCAGEAAEVASALGGQRTCGKSCSGWWNSMSERAPSTIPHISGSARCDRVDQCGAIENGYSTRVATDLGRVPELVHETDLKGTESEVVRAI